MSPVLMTSDRRKNTMLSASVVCRRHVRHHHGFAVEEEVLVRREEIVVGPDVAGDGGHADQTPHDVLVCDHARPPDRGRRRAETRERVVAAEVIEARARVDDPANRLAGQRTDRREHPRRLVGRLRVDHQHAVGAGLHRDIAAAGGGDDHVNLALHQPDDGGVGCGLRG